MDAPTDIFGTGLAGVGLVVGTTAAGAALGAIAMPACPKSPTATSPICGPGWGALLGSTLGLAASGVVGLGVAIFSPSWRAVGLTAAGIVGGLAVVGAVGQALSPKPTPPAVGA